MNLIKLNLTENIVKYFSNQKTELTMSWKVSKTFKTKLKAKREKKGQNQYLILLLKTKRNPKKKKLKNQEYSNRLQVILEIKITKAFSKHTTTVLKKNKEKSQRLKVKIT